MLLHRIHIRLTLSFFALLIAVLAAGGLSIQWSIRRSMEEELGKKLEAVASAASVVYNEEEIGFLLSRPGPRLEEYLRNKLLLLREKTGVKRIYFFDFSNNGLIDTRQGARPGEPVFSLQFYSGEIEAVRRGKPSHTILFEGIDGRPTMTGFSPLFTGGKAVGGAGVEGGATFLGAIETLNRRLLQTALIAAFATVALALFLSKTITRPIARLVRSSERIGRGSYGDPIPSLGGSEIGVLSETMESMRVKVVERERALKAMVAGVAHEIRNPLGGIELFIGLLAEETAGNPSAAAHVDRIGREVRYLNEIVDRFLEYAKPNEPHFEACPLLPILREIAASMQPELTRRSVVLSLPGENWTAAVDPNHFKRMSLNLIQNAVQAIPDGGRISIRGKTDGLRLRLEFEDTGAGIAPGDRDRIFSPFFTTREKGTGLGLSIVSQLAEANGGRVSLLRSEKGGTVFGLELVMEGS
jgi:signal transduction histidine kinase